MFIIVILLIISLALFYASYSISLGVYVKSFCKNKNAKNCVAITFDDGVDPITTPKVLDTLAKHNAKATFFIIGENATKYPDIVKRIINEGHEIGNHSLLHKPTFPMQSSSKILNEITETNAIIEDITKTKIKFFRPPFGVTNPPIAKAIKMSNLKSIGWSIRSLDTVNNSTDKTINRILTKLKHGDIILLHDNRPNAHIITDTILQELKTKNYKTLTISQLINK